MANNQGVILVTGCSGRIGKLCMERFSKHYRVVGFDIVEPKEMYPNTDFIKMDLSSDESVKAAFDEVKKRYGDKVISMVHLAAYYSFSGDRPELYDIITVNGSRRLLQNLHNFDCEQFLFSSTQLVYAPTEPGVSIDEDSPIEASWGYPASKIRAENVMKKERGKMPLVMMRIAGCYDDGCHSIPISNQIQRIFENQLEARVFPGDLTHGSPFLHLDDLVDSIWLCIQKRKELPEELVLLIGESKTMSMDQMQRTISRLIHGKEFTTFRVPKWFAKMGAWFLCNIPFMEKPFIRPWMIDYADCHYELDISLAKKLLGWEPKHYVKDSLAVMIRELKKDPIKFYKENGLKIPHKIMKKYGGKN